MRTRRNDERGMALIMVMLLTVAVAALVAGAIFLTSSSTLISKGQEREEEMRNAADAGIELGRSKLNGGTLTMPTTGYSTLFVNQVVYDANNVLIPGVTRSVYYGPTASTTGQYGVFGSVVAVITDASGAVVVRRGELNQESFAKFGYFSISEGSGICFWPGDNFFGPLHTNGNVCISNSGYPAAAYATFWKPVEVGGTIDHPPYGIFKQGYTQNAAAIALPTLTALSALATYATTGGMNFTEPAGGSSGNPRIRIQFYPVDLDGDGKVTGPTEGFFRVYQDTGVVNTDVLIADRVANAYQSRNCGHYHTISGRQVFFTANQHYLGIKDAGNITVQPPSAPSSEGTGISSTVANKSLWINAGGIYRCWLGGDEHLQYTYAAGGFTPRNTFLPADSFGTWVKYTSAPDPAVIAGLANASTKAVDTTLASRTLLAQYLWPIARANNPNSKGVIYFNGRVAVDGVLNGRLTVAASSQVMIADDITYAVAPGSTSCLAANMLGLIGGDSILIADNAINAPWDYTQGLSAGSSGGRVYDDTPDLYIHGVVLTLKSWGAEHYNTGQTSTVPCQGIGAGRGCVYLTGGVIQGTRGSMGTGSGTGYAKEYSYDQCAFQTPPPYFPTTGRYDRNRYYEIDPVGFSVAAFFNSLTP